MRKGAAGISPVLFGAGALVAEVSAEKRREANQLLIEIERAFALPDGIPNRNWFKHLVFGTRSTYAALLLPELTEAAEAGNEKGVDLAIAHLEASVSRATLRIKNISGILGQPGL